MRLSAQHTLLQVLSDKEHSLETVDEAVSLQWRYNTSKHFKFVTINLFFIELCNILIKSYMRLTFMILSKKLYT